MSKVKRKIKHRLLKLKPLAKGALIGALAVFTFNSIGYVPLVQFLPYTVQFKIVPNSIDMTAGALK